VSNLNNSNEDNSINSVKL